MTETAIFDLDGTLMDTMEDLYFAMNEMLTRMGYPNIDREEVRRYIGNGAREFVRLALRKSTTEDEKVDECLRVYGEIYAANSTKYSKIYEGILPLLDRLKGEGVRLAVLSNKPDPATNAVVSNYFGERFDLVRGELPGVPVKPDPAGILLVLRELGAKPETTAFIGDGDTDYYAATAAGLRHIGVLWGYRTREELASYGVTDFARNPEELYRKLREN